MKYWVIAKDNEFLTVDYTFDVEDVWEFAYKADAEDVLLDLKMNGVAGAEAIVIECEAFIGYEDEYEV